MILWAFLALYIAYEGFKTTEGSFRVNALRAGGQSYLPLVEESFYKAWGPLVIALDAARNDLLYLFAVPAYALAFRPHMRIEWGRIRQVRHALAVRWSRQPSAWSGEGS